MRTHPHLTFPGSSTHPPNAATEAVILGILKPHLHIHAHVSHCFNKKKNPLTGSHIGTFRENVEPTTPR